MSIDKVFYSRTAQSHFENGFNVDLPESDGRTIHPELEQYVADEAYKLGVCARMKLLEITARDKRLATQ